MAWTCGYILDIDVLLGKWDEKYVKWSERVDDDHTKIHLMISDSPPKDGTIPELENVDLGFNDNDHYYGFDVVMHNDDIEDDLNKLIARRSYGRSYHFFSFTRALYVFCFFPCFWGHEWRHALVLLGRDGAFRA